MGGSAIIELVNTLVNLGYKIWSTKKAQKEADKQENILEGRYDTRVNDLNAWYNKEYNTPVGQTDYGKSFLGQLNMGQEDLMDRLDTNAVTGGSTEEAKIASQGMLQNQYAKGLASLMQYGDTRNQGIRNQYMYQLKGLNDNLDAMTLGRMQGWYNWSDNAARASDTLAYSVANVDWEKMLQGGGGAGYPNDGYDSGGYGISAGPTSSWP